MSVRTPYEKAIGLLKQLISIPSPSREEVGTADAIASFLENEVVGTERSEGSSARGINRIGNNVWAYNRFFDQAKPTILLNSHHDTVKPNPAYTRDPYSPDEEDGKLYGLGSNDAGASLVSLISTFLHYYNRDDLAYNLCLALTAEEEISGLNGMELGLKHFGKLDFAIVGEPTNMQMAVAERGLMVLDCVAHGKAGHAARDEGENAIYNAMRDIEWMRSYRFPKESPVFGHVKMNVTVINAGTQHNVVPAECSFTVDVRVTEQYTHQEVLDIIRSHVKSDVTPRSTRIRPSSIAEDHPVVIAGKELGLAAFGSPTTSDQAFLTIPSLKIGVGDSSRSHMADEFVYLKEIEKGIETYIALLSKIL